MVNVYRSETWWVNLNPPGKGKEIHGKRPALIISEDEINNCPADLVIVLPITTTFRNIPSHIKVDPPDGGFKKTSYVKCDQIRTISKKRLIDKIGKISEETMSEIEYVLKIILSLS
ncbi:MAG: type II toxin-antitoxin system PemK/MazF family toxin [Pseudomonadota bacterium]